MMARLRFDYPRALVGAVLALAFAAVLVAGCGSGSGAGDAEKAGVTRTYERGPITVELALSADTLTTAETLTVTLTAITDAGHMVEFPSYPEIPPDSEAPQSGAPQAFTLSGVRDADPVLREGDRIARSRTYLVEPFLDGAYEVPALGLTYWEEREGEDEKATLETDAIAVTVTPLLAPGEPPSPRDIAGPVALRDPPPWGLYLLLAALAAALAGAGYWYWFRYTPPGPPPAPPVPPHQRALEALDAIRRARLVEQGRYKEYYIAVSGVLRRYMEEQFQLRAPERTTEEFLADLQDNAVLGLQEQLLLREFLRHCDLVKFARAEPTPEQIRDTIDTCERFIIDSEAAQRAARARAGAGGEG